MDIYELSLADLPEQLSHIPQPPASLYARGRLPPEGTRILAVVGSRALSDYGREACQALVRGLAGYPVSIVSGLALGADGCAHDAALSADLHTIAVPGSGLHGSVLGPRSHFPLACRILDQGGLLLSEHPPTHIPRPHDFPSRNRIMVGLSHAVLMIEAGPDSGTLITAGLAGEYGRELLCVPHRIGDLHAYGMSRFARLGATIVTEPEHILEALGIDA
jgi:DNA processing protein